MTTLSLKQMNHQNQSCNGNISACNSLLKLSKIMNTYYKMNENIFDSPIVHILNYFLHLIHEHNTNQEFEFIYTKFECCDIKKRAAFKLYNDQQTSVYYDILDKIHCYYLHSYDIGHRLSKSDRIMINYIDSIHSNEQKHDEKDDNSFKLRNKRIFQTKNILSQKRTTRNINIARHDKYRSLFSPTSKPIDAQLQYDFGFNFKYGYYDEEAYDNGNGTVPILVTNKYKTLKQELLHNKIAKISIGQFDKEYQKTGIHFKSDYCKAQFFIVDDDIQWTFYWTSETTLKQSLNTQHLLSLMIYCNFTQLQYKFSKTYRENN
eukprot:305895_1